MTTPTGFRLTPQAVLGLGIVALGLLLTADNFNIVEADHVWRYWPLILVAVGLVKLAQATTTSAGFFGGLLTLAGAWWTANNVFFTRVGLEDVWPLGLVFLGIVILVRASSARRSVTGPAGSDQVVSEVAFWAGKQRRNAAPNFKHADLTAVMGGVELDLRAASTLGGEAIVDVFVMWGGVEIWVPPDWAVSNQVSLLMGGAEDASTGTQDAKNRLIVRGFVIMGGLEIKT